MPLILLLSGEKFAKDPYVKKVLNMTTNISKVWVYKKMIPLASEKLCARA